jgi:methionyl aminopeptidase
MIKFKTEQEVEIMRQSGKILAEVLGELIENVRAGISEIELDRMAERLIIAKGAQSRDSKKVQGYNNTICISTNDVVVHGIPTDYVLKARRQGRNRLWSVL